MFYRLILSCWLLGWVALAGGVRADAPYPAEQIDQLGKPLTIAASPRLSGAAAKDAELTVLNDQQTDQHGPGFRVVTRKQPGNHYDIEVRVPLKEGAAAGDVLFASFWARAVDAQRYETGEAFTLFRVQHTAPPYERTLYKEWSIGPQWQRVYLASRVDKALPAGSTAAVFSAGYPPQTLEVAGLEVRNLGKDADPAELPRISTDYLGSDPDAEWRKRAEERIERHRKQDLTVRVVDQQGQPVEGATVRVELERHAFGFGVAISAKWLHEHWDSADAERYRQTLTEWFNSVSLENALKWERWESEPEVAMRTLRWIDEETDLRVHGHVLVWPGLEKFRTPDAKTLWAAAQDNPGLLADRVDAHIASILTETAGLVDVWDVVNEAYNQNEFIELLGEGAVAHWFKRARRYAPDATLLYNDFGLLGQSGTNRVKQQFVYDLVKHARAQGAPIDAIGLQSHLGGGYTPPARVLGILDKFAELGVTLKITEYDLTTRDADVAERYTRDFLTAVFSHPSVTGFQAWNFWEGQGPWMPEASFFARDWSEMPVGRAYRAMVLERWQTDETLATETDGVASVRGFKGGYRVTVTAGDGATAEHALELSDEPAELTVTLGE